MNDAEMKFVLAITDFFHGHYEDPEWGKRGARELLALQAAGIFSREIADPEARQHLSEGILKATARVAQRMSAQDSEPPSQKTTQG